MKIQESASNFIIIGKKEKQCVRQIICTSDTSDKVIPDTEF